MGIICLHLLINGSKKVFQYMYKQFVSSIVDQLYKFSLHCSFSNSVSTKKTESCMETVFQFSFLFDKICSLVYITSVLNSCILNCLYSFIC